MSENKVHDNTGIGTEIVKGAPCVKLNFKFVWFWHFIKRNNVPVSHTWRTVINRES
jgi:hypothetical protein